MEEVTEKFSGTIDKITYKNDQNGYTVATLRSNDKSITVVGIMPFANEGESVTVEGGFITHPTYGSQFKVTNLTINPPENTAAILRYLSSGIIKGVGPFTAQKIVDKFGADSLDIIQNSAAELSVIKGITNQRAEQISQEYKKQYGVRDIMMLLSPYNATPEQCIKIFKKLGKDAAGIIKENPYILCSDGINYSFENAEQIAENFRISPDSEDRLGAGIVHIMKRNLMNGHTCLPRNKLTTVAIKLLESDYNRIESICDKLIETFVIVSKKIGDTEFLSLNEFAVSEEYIAARLCAVSSNLKNIAVIDDLEIDYVENRLGIKFENMQRQAIKKAFNSGVMILTGGPGTGKTTTLRAIIELFEMRNYNVTLTAPTGRAAKRMSELTGKEAKTIHRLLEVEWGPDEKQFFSRNEKNQLECDVIIVDEASMIDTLLFENLMRALRLSCRIILVGDSDQLPSVSAGNVLGDILASGRFSTVMLNKIFRQAKKSLIVTNAHAIINGDEIDLSNSGSDFFIMNRSTQSEVCETVLELCSSRLTSAYGFDPLKDIQVLCPSRKLDTGSLNLNNLLQEKLNPLRNGMQQLSYKGVYFRTGDKVMQIKNNYNIEWVRENKEKGIGVFNGDVGFITSIDRRANIVTVKYDDRTATYLGEEIGELELAYAITVHKSQGSEFDCVVLPLLDVPTQLRYRNLLYTAVTRAKKMLIVVGSGNVLYQMAQNDRKALRYTLLKEYIDEVV